METRRKLSVEQAFHIYRRGYVVRLIETLGETFEAVWWVLGDEAFYDVCQRYINLHPSSFYDLSDYGHDFPAFLQESVDLAEFPFLYDLARFEWLFKDIYHASNPDPVSMERVQEMLQTEDFRVHFVKAMDIFESPYSVYEFWSRRKEVGAQREDIVWRKPESLLIYKKQMQVVVHRLGFVGAQVLLEMKEGLSITEALGDFANSLTPEKITQLFHMMMEAGIIEDVSVVET